MNFTSNEVGANVGGDGGDGGAGFGGQGGNGASGNNGGNGNAGNGGAGGSSGAGFGGGAENSNGGSLTIEPRLGAKKRSKQSKATDSITANQARTTLGATGGAAGAPQAGAGGSPNGAAGVTQAGNAGATAAPSTGIGGGLELFAGGTAIIDNTTITGNTAATTGNNVDGTFTN